MNRARSGLSIIELLIAAAILVAMLGALGALFASSSRAYAVHAGVTAGLGQLRGAVQALQYDTSLAGYCGTGASCTELGEPLELAVGASEGTCRDVTTFRVRYLEDRFTGGNPTELRVAYGLDAEGRLLRSVGSAAAVAIADDIEAFQFCGYRTRSDANGLLRFNRPEPGDLLGIELRLTYRRAPNGLGEERFAVTLPNVP